MGYNILCIFLCNIVRLENYCSFFFFFVVPSFLVDLHVKLLRRMGKSSVSTERWERYVIKVQFPIQYNF